MSENPRARKKQLGAFYTSNVAVDFLVRWGMNQVRGVVLDPSCGDGRFLTRAAELGAQEVIGCELDPQAVSATRSALAKSGVNATIHHADFFALDPAQHPKVDVVVGNPPFIRYQRFTGESRRRALESALHVGVHLSALTSAWAPFVIHSIRFLRPGGAMAMVVPAEIVQTKYGILTLKALCRSFSHISLLVFARNFFDDAQAETYLLLAEGAGHSCNSVDFHPFESIQQLAGVQLNGLSATTFPVVGAERMPFALAFLTADEREAWRLALENPAVVRLADLGEITNGYVTGSNAFFHSTREAALAEGLPAEWLRPSVTNAASLRGLEFTIRDVEEIEEGGRPQHLLDLPDDDLLNSHAEQLSLLVKRGMAQGVQTRFKCRTRDPWWRVPGTHTPDIFLPYMIGREPVSSVNRVSATHTNTIHGFRLHCPSRAPACAMALLSTLSLLSMELEGRTYGGGILKLEPSEMEQVRVAVPARSGDDLHIDQLLRSGDYEEAVACVDDLVLRDLLGFGPSVICLLRSARHRLVMRRYSRESRRGN
jgi:adenine-specific DNA-methyltransferase